MNSQDRHSNPRGWAVNPWALTTARTAVPTHSAWTLWSGRLSRHHGDQSGSEQRGSSDSLSLASAPGRGNSQKWRGNNGRSCRCAQPRQGDRNLRSPKPKELGRWLREGRDIAQSTQRRSGWPNLSQDGAHVGCGGHPGALGDRLETWASVGEPGIPRTAK